MADTTATASVDVNAAFMWQGSCSGPYWIDTQKAIIVFSDVGSDISFTRTTDGGQNWSSTEIETGTTRSISTWFDKETPGDNGTLVHVAWLDIADNELKYVTLDVDDGSVGTVRTIVSGLTVQASPWLNRVAITKTVSGNIIVNYSTDTEKGCFKSNDNFATPGTSIASPEEDEIENDGIILFPAATADDNDACCIFWDRSSEKITIKMYDDSEDLWDESGFSMDGAGGGIYMNMDAAVRHSDGKIIFAFHTNADNVADILRVLEFTVDSITSPAATAKTSIYINQAESTQAAVLINQQNDDIYVAYLKGGTWQNSTDVVFHKSEDGGTTWGSEQSYSETTDDNRLVHGGRTIGSDGGRIQWSWYNEDLTDIYVNLVNDIEISASGGGGETNMKINIGDSFKDVDALKINIGDSWKDVVAVKQNIGDSWKSVF